VLVALAALGSATPGPAASASATPSLAAGWIPGSPNGAGPPHGAATWDWPVPAPHRVVRPFVAPPTPYAAGHRGLDLTVPAGTEVRAPADGIVHFAGVVVDRGVLSIEHAGGVLSSFEPVDALVARGERVRRGQVVGVLAESAPGASHCAESCLHLGARIDGEYVNPLLLLDGLDWSVLYAL